MRSRQSRVKSVDRARALVVEIVAAFHQDPNDCDGALAYDGSEPLRMDRRGGDRSGVTTVAPVAALAQLANLRAELDGHVHDLSAGRDQSASQPPPVVFVDPATGCSLTATVTAPASLPPRPSLTV